MVGLVIGDLRSKEFGVVPPMVPTVYPSKKSDS